MVALRTANIVVGNCKSSDQILEDMVFQGTVLGPGLWNVMYEDAREPIAKCSFTEIVYADDLDAFRASRSDVGNSVLIGEMQGCQKEFRSWGACSQVEFDPGKESMHVVARQHAQGGSFKILGVKFDCKGSCKVS